MTDPKRHHFIPRLHLQHFIGTEPKGHVWTYEKQTGNIRSAVPDETAVESNFYSIEKDDGTMDTHIEKKLSQIEGEAAPVYEMLLRGEIPTDPQQRTDFAHFLALMYVRTPAMRRMIGKMLSQELQVMNYAYATFPGAFESLNRRVEKETGRVLSDERKELIRQTFEDPSGYEIQVSKESTLSILGAADNITPVLEKMRWSVFQARHGFFITSDNPLLRNCDPKTRHPIYGDHGFVNPTNVIIFPLSRQKLLFLCFNPSVSYTSVVERDCVDAINKFIAGNADRYLYTHLKHKTIDDLARKFKDTRPDMDMQGFGPDKFAATKVMRRFKR